MSQNSLSKSIDELSVVARQCIAAVCFERYCAVHHLEHADIRAFIDHIWRICTIESPEQFVEWEQGFLDLRAAGWGDSLAKELLEIIPTAIRKEYEELAHDVIETSATTWYGSDMEGTREYLLKVIRVVSKYRVQIPNFDLFRSSSPQLHDGWGDKPSPVESYAWRHNS